MNAELSAELVKNGKDGARAWWDGYPITATCTPHGSLARMAFENGWRRALADAIAKGLAVEGADNTLHAEKGSR